jgi:hypothetical protein
LSGTREETVGTQPAVTTETSETPIAPGSASEATAGTQPVADSARTPVGDTAGSSAEGEGGEKEAVSPKPSPPPPEPDWRDKRIATLTRRLRDLQEQTRLPATGAGAPAAGTQADIDARIEARAREISVIQEFNRRCDEAAMQGRSKYGETEFNSRVASIQRLVDNSDPGSIQAYNALLQAAIDTGEGARVLHELGADLNEAQRVLALPPTRMAVELTKRAVAPVVQVSNAPKPITPVGSRGVTHERISPDDPDRSDHLSTREWMARREQQLADRRKAG